MIKPFNKSILIEKFIKGIIKEIVIFLNFLAKTRNDKEMILMNKNSIHSHAKCGNEEKINILYI